METPQTGSDGFTALLARMDRMRDELMARMDKLATTDSLTQLISRVAGIERTMADWPRRPADEERLHAFEREMGQRVRALEEAPKVQADKKSKELRNLAGIIGAIVAVVGACNGCAGIILTALVQLLLHILK